MTITQGRIRFWGSALGVLVFGLAVTSAMAQTSSRPSTAAARPLTAAERRTVEELEAARKQFDTAAARVMAASPHGRRRVAEAIAPVGWATEK